MLKIIPIALLLFSLTQSTIPATESAQRVNPQRDSSADARAIPSLGYCVLLERSNIHIGKLVRLNASWQFGFETTFLHARECSQQPGAWLEFADEKELCPAARKNRDAPGPHDKEADVTVIGRLIGPGRYGHLGAYQYKFVVTCLQKIKITASDLK